MNLPPRSMGLPRFDLPDLARAVEALEPSALDALPYGSICLDANGTVVTYSAAERQISGSGDRPRLGLDFFSQVAPCMDTPQFRGRIERARAAGRIDLEFGWTGDFADRLRSLRVRVQSATGGGLWIFMLRDDD